MKSKPKEIKYKYFPKDRDELVSIIEKRIREDGYDCDLNDIDVSLVTDMNSLFSKRRIYGGSSFRGFFNGDISQWDVHNVTNMDGMFFESEFNGDISAWQVSNAQYMGSMFAFSKFNGDISDWDVSNVDDVNSMFYDSAFNGDLNTWNIKDNLEMRTVFNRCPLEKNPPKWYKK